MINLDNVDVTNDLISSELQTSSLDFIDYTNYLSKIQSYNLIIIGLLVLILLTKNFGGK